LRNTLSFELNPFVHLLPTLFKFLPIMKFALFALPLAASAAVLEARQGKGGKGVGGGAPVAGIDKLAPRIRTDGKAQRTLTKFGREYLPKPW
jgi:hypothetical protein